MADEGVSSKLAATQLDPASTKQSIPAQTARSIFEEGFLKSVYEERPGDVITRFPPEPNGFLHIGHVKAVATNFGFAKHHEGKCILRFDDTNPVAEEERYFLAIIEVIRWLGFEPYRTTYSSDNFQKLFDLANELIRRDGAYVCHCTDKEMKEQRGEKDGKLGGERFACPHRDRPIQESLEEFERMREGKYKPQQAILRMKQDLKGGNPEMWDKPAYRVLDAEHHRTGDKWKIYPTYDYTHPLCDSIEEVTQSLCTTEFVANRVSYDWLIEKLGVYAPMQREFGRLNVTGTVLSKRKIKDLVDKGTVRDWDDPRLFTIAALRRRGVPPGALLSFVGEIGVSTALTTIQLPRFEQSVRKYLDPVVPRLMLVLDPIRVVIDDVSDDHVEDWDAEFGPPRGTDMGTHNLPLTKVIFIDRKDFREDDSDSDFRRLRPGKQVGLLKTNSRMIIATSYTKDEATGLVDEIHASIFEYPEGTSKKKKDHSYLHWVAESPAHSSPVKVEVREFSSLFKSGDPDTPDGELSINNESEKVYSNAIIEIGIEDIRARAPWPEEAGEKKDSAGEGGHVEIGPETVRFQGVREGFYCLDKDTSETKIVVNRIVSLKEDSGKEDDSRKKAAPAKKPAPAKKEGAKKKKEPKKKEEGTKGVPKEGQVGEKKLERAD